MLSLARTTAIAILITRVLAASTPREIAAAGVIAGRHFYSSAETSTETSFEDQWARMVKISECNQRIFSDPSAQAIWSDAQRSATHALAILARIADVDNRKPSDWDAVISALKAAGEQPKGNERREWGQDLWLRLLMEVNKSNLQDEFRGAESAVDAKLSELAGTASSSVIANAIGITHLPSWQGAYDTDLLVLTNQTGRDLSSLGLFVTFRSNRGTSVTHVHGVSRWANNQPIYFRYPYYKTDYASGQTLDEPVRVEITAFSPDGHFQGVYVRDDQTWTDTIRHYVDDVKLSGTFLGEYTEEGTNKRYYPGFKFSMKGLNRLPVKRITIRLTHRGETKEVYWDWNKYVSAGEDVVLRSELFSRFGSNDPPESKQIILEFTDSPVPANFTW